MYYGTKYFGRNVGHTTHVLDDRWFLKVKISLETVYFQIGHIALFVKGDNIYTYVASETGP